jgi:hypothetical protein
MATQMSQITADAAKSELARRELERRRAKADPLYLISNMSAPDERTAETFSFGHLVTNDERWGWQRDFLRWIHAVSRGIILKARQLGATWLCCAYVVWVALYRPGSLCLMYRQKHDEAVENVIRAWTLLGSLPRHLLNGAVVVIPARGEPPRGGVLELRFPDGSVSRIVAESSAAASGHGKTAAVIVLDEFSRIDAADEIIKAVQPAAGATGKILIPSTANGVSNQETGAGNRFHWIWTSAEEEGYEKKFLPWSLHPDRDQDWYDKSPEIRGLRAHERAEQYPANEHEAFTLTNRVFFDPEDLAYYSEKVKAPLYRCDFVVPGSEKLAVGKSAELRKHGQGFTRVYAEPVEDRKYALGADCATGRGLDYSCAYVVDLMNGELAAEFHGKLDADLYAAQLHYLGRRYGTALIAPDNGGIGEAVIVSLRHAREGRPPYPNLYRHQMSARPGMNIAKVYGYPINVKTRPLILNQLEKWVRERTLPWVTSRLLSEMQTFIERDKDPSPAAQDGAHDDAIFAAAIALELFRLRGSHPEMEKRRSRERKPRKPMFPWQAT